MKRWTLILALGVIGCGDPDPNKTKPAAPEANNPAFAATSLDAWYLIGDAATPGHDEMAFSITAPSGTSYVDAYIADLAPVRMTKQGDGFALDASIKEVPAGTYDVLFSANGSATAFAKFAWNRSAPYYVLVSTDYDFSEMGDNSITFMNNLHAAHKDLRITHFWAPYTYTDPAVSEARRTVMTSWLQTQHDTFNDEVALHIHPYCNFVTDAGLTCITDQSSVYPSGDPTGYTIKVAAYDRSSVGVLFDHARALFAAHNLPAPVTFRAGGWTANAATLQALNDKGFIADSSALNWARIEEWKGYNLYDWNMAEWLPINDTTQPYYPSSSDIVENQPGSDLALLEAPVNGVMMDYIDADQIKTLFTENWDGAPLASPHVLMSGYHPSAMTLPMYTNRLNQLCQLADANLASAGLGPVVYITLQDLVPVFPEQ